MKQLIALCLLALLALSIACGGDSDDSPSETSTPVDGDVVSGPELLDQPEPAQALSAQVTEPNSGVVDIVASGVLFQQNNISVPLGEAVVIRVTNSDLVTHNLRIAGLDGEFETQDDAVTEPDTLAGGENGEVTFAPPVAGSYTFRCDFHPSSMGGIIVVS